MYNEALTMHERREVQDLLYKIARVGMYWQAKRDQPLDFFKLSQRKAFSKWRAMASNSSNYKSQNKSRPP